MSLSNRLRRAIAVGAVGLACVAGLSDPVSASSGSGDSTTSVAAPSGKSVIRLILGRLDAEQRACLAEAGVTLPIRPITVEKIITIRDAARSCGIRVKPWQRVYIRNKVLAFVGHLSAEQRECLATEGVARPFFPLTIEKLETLRDAIVTCEIELPAWATASSN